MTLLEQIEQLNNELHKGFEKNRKFLLTKQFTKLIKQIDALTIEYNKSVNAYWHYENWIKYYYEQIIYNAPDHLKGNDLTNYVANELNKLDGVLLERYYQDEAVNYNISVVTPYLIYYYSLRRGYGKQCGFEKAQLCSKSRANISIYDGDLCDLIYGRDAADIKLMVEKGYKTTKELLEKEYNHDFLHKL